MSKEIQRNINNISEYDLGNQLDWNTNQVSNQNIFNQPIENIHNKKRNVIKQGIYF